MAFIKIDRKFFEGQFWEQERIFSYAEAWIDLIQLARYQEKPEKRLLKNGRTITINRGELHASLRYLAKRWNWSVGKVSRFLEKAISEDAIKRRTEHCETILTLSNYGTYNQLPDDNEYTGGTPKQVKIRKNRQKTKHQTEHQTEHQKHTITNNNTSNYKEEKNGNETPNGTPNETLIDTPIDTPAEQTQEYKEGKEYKEKKYIKEKKGVSKNGEKVIKTNHDPPSQEVLTALDGVIDTELDECQKALSNDIQWKEIFCMNNRIRAETFDKYLEQYFKKLQNEGVTKKSERDAKFHFANWFRIEYKRRHEETTGRRYKKLM